LIQSLRIRSVLPHLVLTVCCGAAGVASAQAPAEGFDWSGVQRTRFEVLDPQFRAGFDNSDQAVALQTSLVFNWRRAAWHVGGELMDSRHLANDENSLINGTMTNTLEPIQAYVAWQHGTSTLRIGRVTQDLGKRRLVSRNRYRNTLNNFTGIDWTWSGSNGRVARAFYWLPMRPLPSDQASLLDNDHELDRGLRGSSIAGLFYEFPAFGERHRLESYFFDAEAKARSDPAVAYDLLTLGARAYRAPRAGETNYEIELVLQDGDSGGNVGGVARSDLEHRASFVHLEIGYQFAAPGSPNLTFQYDRATGDEDPTDLRVDRFNTLFGARRFDFGPTGIYGIVARSNVDSPGVRLTMQPGPRWQAMLSYRSLRLEASRDAWIGSGWRDTSGAAGDSLGGHLEGNFVFTVIPDRLSIDAGFSHLYAGRFPKQTAGAAFRGDPQYFYAAITTNF
jgi:hypothetical protein